MFMATPCSPTYSCSRNARMSSFNPSFVSDTLYGSHQGPLPETFIPSLLPCNLPLWQRHLHSFGPGLLFLEILSTLVNKFHNGDQKWQTGKRLVTSSDQWQRPFPEFKLPWYMTCTIHKCTYIDYSHLCIISGGMRHYVNAVSYII